MGIPFRVDPALDVTHCDVREGYRRWAPRYDQMLTDTVDGDILRALLPRFFNQSEHRILDIACGTGRNIEWLRAAGVSCTAVGCDICPEMLAYAREKKHL